MSGHPTEITIMDQARIQRTLTRMAHEILEKNSSESALAIVGIHTGGAYLGRRLKDLLEQLSGREIPLGELDISFYRDDVARRGLPLPASKQPEVKDTDLPFPIDEAVVVLVDDVLYTGRISVRLTEHDGRDEVVLVRGTGEVPA